MPKDTTSKQYTKNEGEKHDISLKILHQAGFETARNSATLEKRRALSIAPCSPLNTSDLLHHQLYSVMYVIVYLYMFVIAGMDVDYTRLGALFILVIGLILLISQPAATDCGLRRIVHRIEYLDCRPTKLLSYACQGKA